MLTAQIDPLSSNIAFALVKCVQRELAVLSSLPSRNHLPDDVLAATITVSTRGPKSKQAEKVKACHALGLQLPAQMNQEAVPPASWAGRRTSAIHQTGLLNKAGFEE